MAVTWTVAFRKPTGPWFRRVADLELTWHQARELASRLGEVDPTLVVWYTTSTAWDRANPTHEDSFNILTDAGKRVAIRETGVLPKGVEIPDADEAKARWEAGAV